MRPGRARGTSGWDVGRRNRSLGATASLTSTGGVGGLGLTAAGGGAGAARGCGVEAAPERQADRLLLQHIVISLHELLVRGPAGGRTAEPFQ